MKTAKDVKAGYARRNQKPETGNWKQERNEFLFFRRLNNFLFFVTEFQE
jgi:hypothetical protein